MNTSQPTVSSAQNQFVFFLISLLMLSGNIGFAQGIVLHVGTRVTINAGTSLTTSSSIHFDEQSSFTNNGNLVIEGDWINVGLVSTGAGEVNFTSATSQVIGGSNPTQFHNLMLSNEAVLSLETDCLLDGTLLFHQGKAFTALNRVVLNAPIPAAIQGVDLKGYVEGNLSMSILLGNHSVKYEIAELSYAPFNLTLSNVNSTGSVLACSAAARSPNETPIVPLPAGLDPTVRVEQHWVIQNDLLKFDTVSILYDFENTAYTGDPNLHGAYVFADDRAWQLTANLPLHTSTQAITLSEIARDWAIDLLESGIGINFLGQENESLSVFPNATNVAFNFILGASICEMHTVKLVNSEGEEIWQQNVISANGKLTGVMDTTNFVTGQYVIDIQNKRSCSAAAQL